MKILVTGAAGYIGSVLVPTLLGAGHEVLALDLFRNGIKPLSINASNPRLSLVRCDVNEYDRMYDCVSSADAIIPLAGVVGVTACAREPGRAVLVNREAINFIAFNILRREKKVIYPTTNSGYGVGTETFCTEETPLNPISLYGKTKMAAEASVLATGGVSLRLATVFGQSPSFRPELLVNDFVRRAVMDRAVVVFEGQHRRNFIHVRDVCKALIHTLDNYSLMAGQVYNVGLSEANMTKLELCQRIKRQVSDFTIIEAPVGRDLDQRNYIVSNAKLEATGWAADHSLDDGIAELVRSFI